MQANCPQCGNRIVIDDAKVPDRPFKVKCPKCQNSVSFPGKSAAAAPPAEAEPAPPPGPTAAPGAPSPDVAPPVGEGTIGGRALVCLAGQSGPMATLLRRLGCQVDTIEEPEEGARLLEQGIYDLVVTTRGATPPGKGETLYQRAGRLNPEARRRVFLVLVGDEFKSGEGTQAWAVSADLCISSKDMGLADRYIRATTAERTRLYQVFLDARQRHEAAAG